MEPIDYTKLSQEVFEEINLARQVPNALVPSLVSRLEHFSSNVYRYPGAIPVETYEGEKAVTEAIEFMGNQESLPILAFHKELQNVALEHAEDLAESAEAAHIGTASSTTPAQRISKTFKWAKMVAECIELGSVTAAEIVASLIIDDGNEERSNRKVIFSKNLRLIGVACAPHKAFGVVTVIDFAGGEYEKEISEPL